MKSIAAFFCCIFFLGCSATQLEDGNITRPELLEQYPLPSIPSAIYEPHFTLILNLYILEDGSVEDVIIKDNRIDKAWAMLAKEAILKWKYSPARINNKPVKIWIIQRTIVEISEPCYYELAEIQCDSLSTSQLLYNMLKKNIDFGKLAYEYSVAPSGKTFGILGKIDVMRFPMEIQKEILKLKTNEFTNPLKYGNRFVIYKRLKEQQD